MSDVGKSDIQNRFSFVGPWFGTWFALVFGLFFLVFALGLVFGLNEPDVTVLQVIAYTAFTIYLGALAAGFAGMAFKRRKAEQFTNRLLGLAALGIQMIFVRNLVIATGSDNPPQVVAYCAVALWIYIALAGFLGRQKEGVEKPSYATLAMWPLLLAIQAPLTCLVIFGIPAAVIAGGEALGAAFNHPYLGAFAGLGILVASAWIVKRATEI